MLLIKFCQKVTQKFCLASWRAQAFTRFQASPALPFPQLNRRSECACAKRVVAMDDVYTLIIIALAHTCQPYVSAGLIIEE